MSDLIDRVAFEALLTAYGQREFECGQVSQTGSIAKWLRDARREACERVLASLPSAEEVVVAEGRVTENGDEFFPDDPSSPSIDFDDFLPELVHGQRVQVVVRKVKGVERG